MPDTVTRTKIVLRVPPLAPTGEIQVKTRYGTAVSAASFRVTKGIASFPPGAWPGQDITIAASGLPAFHDITLTLDGSPFGGVATNANGQFSLVRTLPGDLTLGPSHILLAMDQITHLQQKLRIPIFGNWPQARSDPAQTGNGSDEFLINTVTVKHLSIQYQQTSVSSSVVEDGGHLFYGVYANEVGSFDPDQLTRPRTLTWTGPTNGMVTQPPAVANGVVYAVTGNTLYAFNEIATGTQSPLWTATLSPEFQPFAPVVADGRVFVADGSHLKVFDANGTTACSGTPKVCTPLWSTAFITIFGPPAVDAKSAGGTGNVYVSANNGGTIQVVVFPGGGGAGGGWSGPLASNIALWAVAGWWSRVRERLVGRILDCDSLRSQRLDIRAAMEQYRPRRHCRPDGRGRGWWPRLRPELQWSPARVQELRLHHLTVQSFVVVRKSGRQPHDSADAREWRCIRRGWRCQPYERGRHQRI